MVTRKHKQRTQISLPKNETGVLTNNNKMQPTKTERNKKTSVIVQEIKIARLLANNDKKIRDKVLKRLKKWLQIRSQSSFAFTETDFMSLWKGLFYCMWMSDKMLIQEELAESISKLVHCFNSKDTFIFYTNCALRTIGTEWFGIDQYRLDKFSMLVRRIVRQTFAVCKNQSWDIEWVTETSQIFLQLFVDKTINVGFNLHITDIYLEELAKISDGNLPEDAIYEFIKPFAVYLITTNDDRQMKNIMRHVFRYLIFQSDIGLDYMEKFNAWRTAGFPCTHIDDMEKIEISDGEENSDNGNKQPSKNDIQSEIEKFLDPRAGKVDVKLPQIPFNAAKIVELLLLHQFHPSSTAKSRRQLLRLVEEFRELSKGRMPLGIKKIRKSNKCQKKDMNSKKAALNLIQFEKNLFSDKKCKRKRKRSAETVVSLKRNENTSDFDSNIHVDTSNAESESIDATISTKGNLQYTDANVVPFKKQKRSNLTNDKFDDKHEITKNKKKLETMKKSNKIKNIKLNKLKPLNDIHLADKNIKHKEKKAAICKRKISSNMKKFTLASPILENGIPTKDSNNISIKKTIPYKDNIPCKQDKSFRNKLSDQLRQQTNLSNSLTNKKINKNEKPLGKVSKTCSTNLSKIKKNSLKCISNIRLKHKNMEHKAKKISIIEKKNSSTKVDSKLVTKKTILENILQNDQIMSLKNRLPNRKSKQNSGNLSAEKKKVIFGLSRNTAQCTSEYLRQVRKSPSIPFDATRKPLASVLKMSSIPSPFNPFYKKK